MLQNDGVQTDRVLSIHKTVNDLQHRSVEGRGAVKAKDVVLDLLSNAMYIAERGARFNTTIQLHALYPINSHVINKW